MKRWLVWLACCGGAAAQPLLPATPLEPAYHALLGGDRADAWRQLAKLWHSLSSATQRRAWADLQDSLLAAQCGRDMPQTPPPWLSELELELRQRDIPLSRVYQAELRGISPRRDLSVSLRLPDGRDLLLNAAAAYGTGNVFRVESKEAGAAFPLGVYWLTVRSGGEQWRQALPLPATAALDWLRREGGGLALRPPPRDRACPAPWLEQRLLRRPAFDAVWSSRGEAARLQPWPARLRDSGLWASVSLTQASFRGAVSVQRVQRVAGPFERF